jgi:hypothetical protein
VDLLDPLEIEDQLVLLDQLVHQDKMDQKEMLVRQGQLGTLDHKAALVKVDSKVSEEIQETQEVLGPSDPVDLLAQEGNLVQLVQQDQPAPQDKLAKVVSLVHLVLRGSKAHKEKVADRVKLVLLDNKALLEALGQRVLEVPLVLLALLVPRDL